MHTALFGVQICKLYLLQRGKTPKKRSHIYTLHTYNCIVWKQFLPQLFDNYIVVPVHTNIHTNSYTYTHTNIHPYMYTALLGDSICELYLLQRGKNTKQNNTQDNTLKTTEHKHNKTQNSRQHVTKHATQKHQRPVGKGIRICQLYLLQRGKIPPKRGRIHTYIHHNIHNTTKQNNTFKNTA